MPTLSIDDAALLMGVAYELRTATNDRHVRFIVRTIESLANTLENFPSADGPATATSLRELAARLNDDSAFSTRQSASSALRAVALSTISSIGD